MAHYLHFLLHFIGYTLVPVILVVVVSVILICWSVYNIVKVVDPLIEKAMK